MTSVIDIHSAERVLERVRINLRRRDKFAIFSGILSVGTSEVVEDDECPTACTDGCNEKYGRGFVESLKDEKMVAFVVLHEAAASILLDHDFERSISLLTSRF